MVLVAGCWLLGVLCGVLLCGMVHVCGGGVWSRVLCLVVVGVVVGLTVLGRVPQSSV